MKTRVTRIDYESEDGERAASLRRIDSPHVPPLGVTWYLERFEHGRSVAAPDGFANQLGAKHCALTWCATGGQP